MGSSPARFGCVVRCFAVVAALGSGAAGEDRLALLPPVDFNLEEDLFANEPISDADPAAAPAPSLGPPRRPAQAPYGSSAPVSLGGFWAPAVDVSGQPATLAMNAQFARVAAPLVTPQEGGPLWLGIAKFGRLELATDAILPNSLQPVPDQL